MMMLQLVYSASGNGLGPMLLLYLVDTRYETASNYVDYIKYSIIFSWHSAFLYECSPNDEMQITLIEWEKYVTCNLYILFTQRKLFYTHVHASWFLCVFFLFFTFARSFAFLAVWVHCIIAFLSTLKLLSTLA